MGIHLRPKFLAFLSSMDKKSSTTHPVQTSHWNSTWNHSYGLYTPSWTIYYLSNGNQGC
jgi:hypothetical protein